ncbi:endonuclease/exonuclease/phosphatase family metal-dependent hydrolase [Parabacteroides sp. PFB2-10]|uniref:endonuclease/exonuclease/phosphatase family protein n=1 Tax=Parabacteroides sp. PFB2-10 TaxID=1742405 RepID=UPI002472FE01|nr:endonuclease/exonuclease/phosphatase family protein [Parabacteroides sp. PFB2-10]MDH6311311.1 endonuclease/exonuclease/phosphatase family metal-dependent hydrolase [Parabacteroides sp. PFB2-10]MDL2244693.1 endonuclease [Parabacteroides sp. OttesenSCG-928-J18]
MKRIVLLIFVGLLPFLAYSQVPDDFRIMWYNVENLFDSTDDPLTNDNEFLPDGDRRWTPKRYNHKLQQIARVIHAAGQWSTPAIIGLGEVENDTVITHLLSRTPLRNQAYQYVITSGSDPRGINVALLYQRDKFAHIGHRSIPVAYREGREKPTRDILHLWGRVITGDTLDIIACHLPSRSGGGKETEGYRMDATRQMRLLCDSLYRVRSSAHIILMGDFNDTPADKSMREGLRAMPYDPDKTSSPSEESLSLYNLFADPKRLSYPGSHKYQGEWNQLDHIIVSSNLLSPGNKISVIPGSICLFAPSFLFTEDQTHRGVRPLRSFYGYQYEAGFSDHLPLLLDLKFISE